jgi:hypothetical protein
VDASTGLGRPRPGRSRVAGYFRVRIYRERTNRDGEIRTEIRVFGEPVNVEVACWAYRYLHGVFQDMWVAYRLKTKCRKTKQRAYYLGLAIGLKGKLGMLGKPDGESSGSEIVLAYEAKLEEAYKAALGEVPLARVPGLRDVAVAHAGREDGKSINLSRPVAQQAIRTLEAKS